MDEAITIERARHALVVCRTGADDGAFARAEAFPPERYRTAVVVGSSALAEVSRLDPWVVADLAEATSGNLRLVAPFLGAMGPNGSLPPARLLADRLRVEVVAAEGTPVTLSDGSLFVAEHGAGWVSYRPGGRRRRMGPRHPSPWWQTLLPAVLDKQVTQIPAGLWVRRPDVPARRDDPLFLAVPDRDRMYVVLGAPGEEPPTVESVAEMLRGLPDEQRDRAVLADYGGTGVAEAVADVLGAPVRVSHGVPSAVAGVGRPAFVDGAGTAVWRPFAVESVYRPGGAAPLLDRWVAPVSTLSMVEPASYRLLDGWRVDVLARGLLVRPETLAPNPAWTASTRATADLVLAADNPVPEPVLAALTGLVRELPADARDHLRVVPVTAHAATAAAGLGVAADLISPQVGGLPEPGDEPADAPVEPPSGGVVVSADGRVLPAEPILVVTDRDPVPVLPAADRTPSLPAVAAAATAPVVTSAGEEDGAADALPSTVSVGAEPEKAPAAVTPAPPAEEVELPPVPVRAPSVETTALPTVVPASRPTVDMSTSDSPADSVAPTAPAPAPAPPPPAVEVPADARSTPEQRQAVRGRLRSRYDVATSAVTRLLSERPGLRAGPGDQAALLAELAVVWMFAEEPAAPYDVDFHVCLAGGLRRLPTVRTVVARGIPADTDVRPDTILRLSAPVLAAPAARTGLLGPAEALIWTTSARKLDGLVAQRSAEGPAGGTDVVLAAHTRLRVLAVETGEVRRILLAEDGTPSEAALTRLRAAAAARPEAHDELPYDSRWFGSLPAA